jgi:ArsR family transcriptional regulator, cadmium/lead-responsive transcriptional repressor
VRLSEDVDQVFAALADPTRRWMVQALLRERSTSVPRLAAALPITRQAVAKHLATLDEAGLLEREPAAGREVRYRLREGALAPASAWLREAEAAWDDRLGRLKQSVEAKRATVRGSHDGKGGSDGTPGR